MQRLVLGEPAYLAKLVEYPNKTAVKALEDEKKKQLKEEEHYRRIIDRKFLQSISFLHTCLCLFSIKLIFSTTI